MKLFSPAKVNLLLNVLHRRKDGYHDLETVFERIDLGDTVLLRNAPKGIRLRLSGLKVSSGKTNIAYRAAQLLIDRCGVRSGVNISIQKRIPVSAGLGGGSSNAATVLLGLNRLWELRLSRGRLLKWGAELGSDVPFFILQTPFALGQGRGEILTTIRSKKKFWHVLIKPPFGISTKAAYAGLAPPLRSPKMRFGGAGLTLPKAGVRMLVHSIQKGDTQALAGLLTNSLEVSLNKRVTIISKLKQMLLNSGALGALLSGSGSTVFGVFSSKEKAVRAARRLRQVNRSWKVFVGATY